MEIYTSHQTSQETPASNKANTKVAHTTSRVSPWLSPLLYLLGQHLLLPFFFRQIEITGQENIPLTGPVILAPTHRSRWDSLLLPYATGRCVTGRDLRFMVTINECQGLQGWLVRSMGGFPVNPQRPAITTLRHAVELLQQGEILVIYPEGNIYRDGKLHPLKPGIARLSLTAESSHPGLDVKILPVSINYSQPYPQWGTSVKISIGTTLNVADYTGGKVKQNAQNLTSDLSLVLQQLSHQESGITENVNS
ncbi:1-acyl-sn-glycerol-3-phosphate acyltransferase [Nodularia spumigena CS-591/12]|uniref:lysophospholipid acyltransferase family protein n=1 Tax=Nodularia spumigena TaxID=70799 RepID=UPI00232EDA94|nr:1-acyl-sn-glycerol-3-phosphate acyltransferase [Nodularia spumigena]MDB9306594.1 1-acyl-sn-glycerol-3-phosphate acyltransferase [Nodularia spumigena CS-591/12]MDB9345965.1 1-acyl-sn-glycerol-3-phosphate acyltransferase [Nodularia spumigena CS-588/06]MDB9367360.1 1-acyl-sn-glycerol-3-phosphate acyltransferase [Nodularia spumigena CS-586/05]